MKQKHALVSAVLLLLGIPAQAQEDQFLLAPEILQKMETHVPSQRPSRPIAGYIAVEEIDHKTNFKKVYVDVRRQLYVLESGLLGSESVSAFREQESQGGTRGVSLCGLVGLIAESASSMTNTVPLLVGKVFLPNGLKSTVDFNNRMRLVGFDASVPSVCAPVPGSQFTYRTEAEVTRRTSGVFTRTNTSRETVAGSCAVGNERQAASKLHPALQGDYLTVSCDTETGGKKYKTNYAFVLDSGMYLMTQRSGEWQTSILQYTDVRYFQP
jgi:hypothetical protein